VFFGFIQVSFAGGKERKKSIKFRHPHQRMKKLIPDFSLSAGKAFANPFFTLVVF